MPPPAGTHLNVTVEDSDAEDIDHPLAFSDSSAEEGDEGNVCAEAEVPAAVEPAVQRYPLRHRRPPDRLTA